MEQKPVLIPEDVLEYVKSQTFDIETFFNYSSTGTINTYYNQTLKHIITDLIVIPVERKWAGLEPIDETEHDLTKILIEISSTLSTLFEKDQREIEKDLNDIITIFPVQDVLAARMLKHLNKLN